MRLSSYVKRAKAKSPWDFGNSVLYDLCRNHPLHADADVVVAKVWLIGRSYAAAIERRRSEREFDPNDDFYVVRVAPSIVASGIDRWIETARTGQSRDVLEAHYRTTQLFREISGLEKRSLASKYLHFHAPNTFFLYDSRAANALSYLAEYTGRAGRGGDGDYDNEYRKFSEKCCALTGYIESKYRTALTPRELDNLLLDVNANAA